MAATKATKTPGDADLEARKRQLMAIAPTPLDLKALTPKVARPPKAPAKVTPAPTAKVNAKVNRQENPPRPLGTTPETYACRARDCREPNLAPTHADGLCAKHRDAYAANTWRVTSAGMRKLEALRAEGAPLPHTKAPARPRAAKVATKKSNVASVRKPAPAPERVARARIPAAMAGQLTPTLAKLARVAVPSAK